MMRLQSIILIMRQNLHNNFTLRSTQHQGKVKTQKRFTSALVSSKACVSSRTKLSRHSTRSLTISNSRSTVLLQLQQCHITCLLGEADPLVMNLCISIRLHHQDSRHMSRGNTMLHLHHQGNHPSNLEKGKEEQVEKAKKNKEIICWSKPLYRIT